MRINPSYDLVLIEKALIQNRLVRTWYCFYVYTCVVKTCAKQKDQNLSWGKQGVFINHENWACESNTYEWLP